MPQKPNIIGHGLTKVTAPDRNAIIQAVYDAFFMAQGALRDIEVIWNQDKPGRHRKRQTAWLNNDRFVTWLGGDKLTKPQIRKTRRRIRKIHDWLNDKTWQLEVYHKPQDLCKKNKKTGIEPNAVSPRLKPRKIHLCRLWFDHSASRRAAILVHEIAHKLGLLGRDHQQATTEDTARTTARLHPKLARKSPENFERLFEEYYYKVDAALYRKSNDKVYLFSGDQYVRFSNGNNRVDSGYPQPISGNWPGLPARFKQRIDAALWRESNSKIYLFKGDEYVRYSKVSDGIDDDYPQKIAGNWPGLPARFQRGIDAALWRESNGKIYLFKGDEYVRYSKVSDGIDDNYPKKIAGNWSDLPSYFANDEINAALMRWSNNKIYLFKNGQYVRYSNVSSGIDSSYPRSIVGNWRGVID